jgi:hypothetical protein
MKTTIALITVAIVGVCIFTGCLGTVGTLVLGGIQSAPEEGWAEKSALERLLEYKPKKLLSEEEKSRVSIEICDLKHLEKNIKNKIFLEKSKKFCKLQKDDKIYFFKEAKFNTGKVETGYLLVRESKPIKHVYIERKYSKELKKSVPIVERLH